MNIKNIRHGILFIYPTANARSPNDLNNLPDFGSANSLIYGISLAIILFTTTSVFLKEKDNKSKFANAILASIFLYFGFVDNIEMFLYSGISLLAMQLLTIREDTKSKDD